MVLSNRWDLSTGNKKEWIVTAKHNDPLFFTSCGAVIVRLFLFSPAHSGRCRDGQRHLPAQTLVGVNAQTDSSTNYASPSFWRAEGRVRIGIEKSRSVCQDC